MNFLKRLVVLLYVTIVIFVCGQFLLMVFGQIPLEDVMKWIQMLYADSNFQMAVVMTAIFILFVNYIFYQVFSVNVHRDKIIAFDNPSGRVTVSLLALENLIRRLLENTPEIRESKVRAKASRKGISIVIRLNLNMEVSVPSLTTKIQTSIVKKVKELIGMEEPVNVEIYVSRIYSSKRKLTKVDIPKEEELPKDQRVPFHGMRD